MDRWGVACPSWIHNFNDLSILNDSNDKNLVASIQKILFWHLFSSHDIWNLGEKWLRYDNDPDHCMQWNSNQKPFFPTHFWQLLCEASQLLNEWINFNAVCGNRLQIACSFHRSYKNIKHRKHKSRDIKGFVKVGFFSPHCSRIKS